MQEGLVGLGVEQLEPTSHVAEAVLIQAAQVLPQLGPVRHLHHSHSQA